MNEEVNYDNSPEVLTNIYISCNRRLLSGVCNNNTCKNCMIKKQFELVFNNMSPTQRLDTLSRLDSRLSSTDVKAKVSKEQSRKSLLKHIKIFILVMTLIMSCTSAMTMCVMPTETAYTDRFITSEEHYKIMNYLRLTHLYLYDINDDGLINCIDYSLIFVQVFRENNCMLDMYNCEIVRNTNPINGFNHLFVRVKTSDNNWIFIEPQATNEVYEIKKFWGDLYNQKYNHYGETKVWLTLISN